MTLAEQIEVFTPKESPLQTKVRMILEHARKIRRKGRRALARLSANHAAAAVQPAASGRFGVLEPVTAWSLMTDHGGDCHRPAEEFAGAVRAALLGIACQFECLVFIAGLQEPVALARFCDSLGLDCDSETVQLIIRGKHQEIFDEWLCLSTEDRLDDLESYASMRNLSLGQVAGQWLVAGRRDCLVPRGVIAPEKRLFEAHAEVLLTLISQR